MNKVVVGSFFVLMVGYLHPMEVASNSFKSETCLSKAIIVKKIRFFQDKFVHIQASIDSMAMKIAEQTDALDSASKPESAELLWNSYKTLEANIKAFQHELDVLYKWYGGAPIITFGSFADDEEARFYEKDDCSVASAADSQSGTSCTVSGYTLADHPLDDICKQMAELSPQIDAFCEHLIAVEGNADFSSKIKNLYATLDQALDLLDRALQGDIARVDDTESYCGAYIPVGITWRVVPTMKAIDQEKEKRKVQLQELKVTRRQLREAIKALNKEWRTCCKLRKSKKNRSASNSYRPYGEDLYYQCDEEAEELSNELNRIEAAIAALTLKI
ncbi:hypothetical protein FJ364_01295 [Candidatus Dependentiae bacterium]|nr:hypothetical protein [Candidatus Dependentiae bacterium]